MKYEVWFKLVDEEKEPVVDFTQKEYSDAIMDAIDNFNRAGDIARNKKHIYGQEIEEHTIKIHFESDVELEKPTKSFRYFSKNLIDNSTEFSNLVIGGRLLKGVYSGIVSEDADNNDDTSLSDEQMIATLLHWCMSKELQKIEDKKSKRNTIDKIKSLIREYETISQ